MLGPETPAGEIDPSAIGLCAQQRGPLPTNAGFDIVVPHGLELLDWALDHLGEMLTIDMLAAQVHASRSAFTRAFRQRTGSTVWRWLTQQRVVRARE